jgi:undecaprenyl-diphosphatase
LKTSIYKTVPFVAGVAVFLIMTGLLASLSEDVVNREPLTSADLEFSNWLHHNGNPTITAVMFAATFFGSTLAVIIISAGLGLYLLWKKHTPWIITLGVCVFGGSLLNRLLKFLFRRPRPHFDDPILTLTSYSFPSGHTMMATVLFGTIAAYLFTRTRSVAARALIIAGAVLSVLLVAFSRIYLGAHYLSDVLAAMAEGTAWLALCLTALHAVSGESGSGSV